jgi:hypothetical protein
MGLPVRTTTQVRYPWRATFRTVIAAAIGITPLLPLIASAAGLTAVPWVVAVLALAGAITRVLAVPGVEAWLRKYFSPLAAEPKNEGGVHIGA